MKVKNLLILVLIGMVGVTFLSSPANAETGTISVSEIFTSGTYTFTLVDGNPRTYTFSTLLFDNTNYNHVSSFTIYITNSAFFLLESNYTTFTIVSGGTGNGYITYSKTGGYIDYNFNSGTTITGSQIGLSLDLNIFDANNMNAALGSTTFTGQAQSSTKPICIRTSINQCLFNGAGVSGAVSYAAIVSKTLTNGYEVTYPQPNKYLVNITKWGAIGTKIKIHNQTAEQFTESSFNLVNFTSPILLQTGIYINVTTSTGAYTDTLINSSGAPGLPPGNGSAGTNPTNVTKPTTGANIGFDKSSYFVGDNINISWYYSDDAWNSISQKKLKLYLNDLPINTGNAFCSGCIDTSTQSGYYIYQATNSGTLKVNAELGTVFIDVIGTASVSILSPGTSWIALNKTSSYAKQAVNVTYHIGYSVDSYPAAAIEIDTIDQATGNVIDSVFPTSFPDGNILIGVIHPIPAGIYAIKLYDTVKNKYLDTKYLTVVLVPSVIPVAGITASSITTDKSSYFYNDYMQIDFKVDDVNYSNYSIRGEVLNINQSIVTKRIYSPFSDQVGTFTTVVNIDKNQKCEKNLNCWFDVGNNSIQIVAYNSTNSFTIAYANFTVTSTTPDGYGLQVSTQSPKKGEQFTITTIVPSLHTGKLTIMDSGYSTNFSFGIILVPAGTTTTPYTIFRVNSQGFGYYDVILYGDDGLIKGKIPITISSPLIVPTIPGQTGSWTPTQQDISKTCSWLDNWVQLVFSEQGINDITRFMFSLLIIGIVMVMALIASENNFGVSIIIGFLPYSYFVYLSQSTPCGTYMPTWTIVFIALIISVKQRWF